MAAMVDSNVLLDVLSIDPVWHGWSESALARAAEVGPLVINPIIYAEVSARFSRIEDLDDALPTDHYLRAPLPWSAAFLAAKAHRRYRQHGGQRTTTLPDFFIGSHAAIAGLNLLTRDARRYRTYFPELPIIAPTDDDG